MTIDDPNEQGIKKYQDETVDRTNSKSLLEFSAAHPVFFYPGCACDWNPVARFSDVCRVFIFCSNAKHESKFPPFALEDCPKSLKELFGATAACGFLNSDVLRRDGNLQTFRGGRWMRVERKIEVNFGAGGNANTLCKIERKLFLAFLEADPAEIFQRLFVEKGIRPMFVCLLQTQWDGAFGDSLVNAGAARPNYLVGKWPETYPPWTLLWQKYRSWDDRAVFSQRNAQPHQMLDPIHYENLVWVDLPLSPTNIDEAQAVHLTMQEYLAHRWPDDIQHIFIDRGNLPAELTVVDPRLSPLLLSGLPISKALRKLANACDEANVQGIHTGRFGFEYETEALRAVWPTRLRFSLTIHLETLGDIHSLQGFVCDDLP